MRVCKTKDIRAGNKHRVAIRHCRLQKDTATVITREGYSEIHSIWNVCRGIQIEDGNVMKTDRGKNLKSANCTRRIVDGLGNDPSARARRGRWS